MNKVKSFYIFITILIVILIILGLSAFLKREPKLNFNEKDLVASSFSDLFSGDGWIKNSSTTMYQDKDMTAFVFPPKFEWKKASSTEINTDNFIKEESGVNIKCFEDKCLIKDKLSLYWTSESQTKDYKLTGTKINVPVKTNLNNLVNISTGRAGKLWMIGVVEKVDDKYLGNVFFYNGNKLKKLFLKENLFESDYEGVIAVGGDFDNYLIVYGGFNGKAYQVVNGAAKNISNFFGMRIMDKGFHPVVLKGNIYERKEPVWYIYSITEEKPKLIKFFQNGQKYIVGGVDLSRKLFEFGTKEALFYFDVEKNNLKAKIKKLNNTIEYKKFIDLGFEKEDKMYIFSSDLNNYDSDIKIVKITEMELNSIGSKFKFYLSSDNENWERVKELNKRVIFNEGSGLYWKMEIKPKGSDYYSPFFDKLRLDYKVNLER